MEILENLSDWTRQFESGWLAHLQATGQIDWSRYIHPRNAAAPSGRGIRLAESRLLLVTSSGAYCPDSQETFDTENLLGDYSLRLLPHEAIPDSLDYAHGHYDEQYIRADVQTGIPLFHLLDLVGESRLGHLIDPVVSFMGYQPDSARVVRELVPQCLEIAKNHNADAALFAPL